MSHKTHLLSCALKCSSKLQEIQNSETLFQWPSKVHKYQNIQTHTVFVFFFFSLFILKKKQNKAKLKSTKNKNMKENTRKHKTRLTQKLKNKPI